MDLLFPLPIYFIIEMHSHEVSIASHGVVLDGGVGSLGGHKLPMLVHDGGNDALHGE